MNEYLITALKDAEMQQNELAERLGVSANMVCQWAKSHRPVSIEQAVKIEIVTGGRIKAGRLAPDFFALLRKIGYTQAIDTPYPSPD